ncbi:hypothetical protein EST38_g4327 [Candolleomyces aberdarensis]|uniref:Uncharacterized protein n=1 Tax=Candolleomyces aberdarensis TaxID=2316362 RepID=A0A4Q2DR84_9AGAR|nr:hypothetical protein EST38_g4327 [Candolleomyces aberdarensis]
MISTSLQSLSLKYLLAGLVALLSFTSVVALPTAKPSEDLGDYEQLFKRALVHPAGNQKFSLFHGTIPANEAALKVPDLSKSHTEAINNVVHNLEGGGLYLTDSLIAAAQFVCHQIGKAPTDKVHVLMYDWTPPASIKIHETKTVAEQNAAAQTCKAYDMLTGPMYNEITDKHLTKDFWQYALINQKIANDNLKYKQTFVIPCSKVHKGRDLPSTDYEKGQGSNPGFSAYAKTLTG